MLNSKYEMPIEKFEAGKLIVQYKADVPHEDTLKAHAEMGAKLIQHIPELNIDIISIEPGNEMEYQSKYLASENVISAEPDYYMYPTYKPNDPYYHKKTQTSQGMQSQWGLRHINPEPAWDYTHNLSPSIKIAIIDSGIDPNHPDLAGKIVDPINFYAGDLPTDYIDRSGHGTFVAGIAAGITNNKKGIAGTSFNTALIMPIRVGDNWYPYSAILLAIFYAVSKGAKIIQMSFGGPQYSAAIQNALNYAWARGVINIASAGNEGNEQVFYPAGHNNVLAASAIDKSNSLAEFSSWGVDIGVTAPGVEILSTTPTYPCLDFDLVNYDSGDGTSFSAPLVSGVAAMILAVKPTLTNLDVVQIIQRTATPIEDEYDDDWNDDDIDDEHDDEKQKSWNPFFGYGLLNAGKALKLAKNYHKSKKGLGSFYGQVIDNQTGLPIDDVSVRARKQGQTTGYAKRYVTKTNIFTDIPNLYGDGMFRLMNIAKGTYDIYIRKSGGPLQLVQTVKIVPGADVFLRFLV